MTLDDAIADAKALDAEAAAGWPGGFDAVKVRAKATRLVRVLDAACTTRGQAREVVDELEGAVPAW